MVLTSDHVDFNSTYTRLVNKQSLIPSPDEIPLTLTPIKNFGHPDLTYSMYLSTYIVVFG